MNFQESSMDSFSVKGAFESLAKGEDTEISDKNDWDLKVNKKWKNTHDKWTSH